MKTRLKKRLKYMGVFLTLLLGTSIYIVTDHIAPYAIVMPYRVDVQKQYEQGRFPKGIHPKDYGLNYESVEIPSNDSILLKGYWVHPASGTSKGTLILHHGIGGCKEHYLGLSQKLAERGISCLLFDARAHGKSSGKYCTYGYYEKYDVKAVVDYLKARNSEERIGIWGNSMGGAIALQAMEIDKRIQFGIIESTFAEMRAIVSDYQKRFFGFRFPFVSNRALDNAGKIAHFEPDSVLPIKSVTNIDQPILMNHGNADKKIALAYGEALFQNLSSKDKEFHIIEGGGHENLFEMGGSVYLDTILQFLHDHMSQPNHKREKP